MDRLPDVADLARCAGVARAWRDTVRDGLWPEARKLAVRSYCAAAPPALAWAAQRCRGLTQVASPSTPSRGFQSDEAWTCYWRHYPSC